MDPALLQLLVTREMPYGKYKGRVLADLPGNYLAWFAREGFPPGELGRLLALMLELGSLVALRVREPELRGAFRIPLGTGPVAVLALFPFSVLLLVVALSFLDGEYGLPAVTGAAVAITLGPLCYSLARRHARAAAITDPA